ncbi:MAG: TRAP transporter small permease [Treponema sp.]|nr:TRAP transporter small permease [Treponema sp.]
MKKVLSVLNKVENGMIIIAFTVMVLAAFSQVLNRNVFKLGIGWFEELAVYCMIWMTLLGAEMGLRDGSQISVTMVLEKFSGKAKALLQIIIKLIVVIFTVAIARGAMLMVLRQIRTGQITAGLKIPVAVPYSTLVIGFGAMALVQFVTLILLIIRFFNDKEESKS